MAAATFTLVSGSTPLYLETVTGDKPTTGVIIGSRYRDAGGLLWVFYGGTTWVAEAGDAVAATTADGANVTQGALGDAAVAAGATGSISAKLRAMSRDLVANIVLAAGSNLIGKVGLDQTTPGTTDSVSVKSQGKASVVSLARPNDTSVYAAGDVIGTATGSTAALTFANIGPAAGEIMITSVSLEIDVAAIPSGMTSFDLHFYSVTPPSALGDNAAFDVPSGDRASYLGKISLGSPVDLGSTLRIDTDGVNKQLTLASTSVFAYLVTVGTYTPTASAVKVISLHSVLM